MNKKEFKALRRPFLKELFRENKFNLTMTVLAALLGAAAELVISWLIKEVGLKNGAVLWPLRIAIAGVANTPGGAFEIAGLLGREETLRRLEEDLRWLENA